MTAVAEVPTPDQVKNPHRWWALGVIALAQLMAVLDATIVTIALPEAGKELSLTDAQLAWVVASYSLAMGSLLLLGGRIGDFMGRKRIFLIGLIGFAIVSGIGALAVDATMLIAARAGQGYFAALLTPAALALLTVTFVDPAERAKAFAVYGAIAGGGMAVGLILGGVLTEYFSWRWTLGVNVPLSLIAVVLGMKFLTESRAEGEHKYDIPGVIVSALGLGSLVYGFTLAGETEGGWRAPSALAFIVGGFVLLGAFVAWETRAKNPLLPMRVFVDRNRGGSFLSLTLLAIGLSALFFFLTFYFQGSLGLTPVQTGLAFLPFAIAIVATSVVTASLLPKFGPRPLIVSGALIASVGMFILSRLTVDSGMGMIMVAQVLVGVGVAFAVVPLSSTALIGVGQADAGVASALVNAVQQIGAALGITLLNSVAASATAYQLCEFPDDLTGAQVTGFTQAFLIGGFVLIATAVISFVLISAKKGEVAEGDTPAMMG